ncbi:hypothetical protein RSOL_024370 [Rhizoctonia solani AG-3 Rhs1AP]|uniref:Uncharacterized protein n=1 Tax=Rhizoctonia solani AG-3 Rhs1AP TaxID=1086054 RepID=X8IXP9_9AGAM|nr:hypothetical protein RSOL_024370 [Rhizoctonia solani AG-3 Rhs1AP]
MTITMAKNPLSVLVRSAPLPIRTMNFLALIYRVLSPPMTFPKLIIQLGVARCAAIDEALARLARSHVSTKFLRTRASAIGFAVKNSGSGLFDPRVAPTRRTESDEEYDSDPFSQVEVDTDMLPTVLVYRAGQLEHTFIRVDWEAGEGGVPNLLIKHGVLPSMSFSANPGDLLGLQESDEEYDLDD